MSDPLLRSKAVGAIIEILTQLDEFDRKAVLAAAVTLIESAPKTAHRPVGGAGSSVVTSK